MKERQFHRNEVQLGFVGAGALLRIVVEMMVVLTLCCSLVGNAAAAAAAAVAQDDDGAVSMTTMMIVPTAATDPVAAAEAIPRKKILVTGAAGFVGSHVADYLLARGDSVVIIDEVNDYYDVNIKEGNLRMLREKYGGADDTNGNRVTQQPDPQQRLFIYRGDIADDAFLRQVFDEHASSLDAVCHMAARAGVRPSIQNPFIYVHSNIVATVKLMELAVQHKVQNFVFASSSSVYGGSQSVYFSELERVDHPISPYAATKKACELFSYVYQHQYGLNVTALRFFTVYGPRGRPDMIPFMFVDRISRGLPIQQFGDGTSSRDYTYIDDIVQGVVRAVDTPSPYQILNLGKGSGTSLTEFLAAVTESVGRAAIIDVLPDQPGDVPYTCANVSLAREHLGYQATVPFAEGIQRTVQWYKEAYPDAAESRSAAKPATSVLATSKNLRRRRRLLERVLEDEQHTFQRLLQRVLMEDSTAFLEVFGDDSDLLEALLEVAATSRKDQRRRKLQNSEETSWETTPVLKPHTEHKKVLVTGGAGFIGSHVADFLLRRGDSVVVVDEEGEDGEANLENLREKYGRDSGKLSIYRGDICDADFMGKIYSEEKPEWICHLAAPTNVAAGSSLVDPVDHIHSIIESTVRLLELSKGSAYAQGNTIQNFVLASSYAVYGLQESRSEIDNHSIHERTEDDRADYPKTPYGASKKAAELLAYTYHHLYQIPVSALRLFNVYGPPRYYRADAEPFQQQVDRAISVDGSGAVSEFFPAMDTSSSWDYTYIDDVVKGIVSALDRPYGYEIYNLGSGSDSCQNGAAAAAVQGFAERIAAQSAAGKLSALTDSVMNRVVADAVTASSTSMSADGVSCADVRKAEHLLEYKAAVSLQEGIQRTVAWGQQTYYLENAILQPHQPVGDGVEEALEDITWVGDGPVQLFDDQPNATKEEVALPADDPHDSPQEASSSAAIEVAEPIITKTNTRVPSPTTYFAELASAVAGDSAKVKSVGEDKYSSSFPAWLGSLAFLQWLLVVTILFARAYFKTPFGHCGHPHSDEATFTGL